MRSKRHNSGKKRQIAGAQDQDQKCNHGRGSGKLRIIGLGPGSSEYLAPKARQALEQSQVIAGYKTYINLLDQPLTRGKQIISTGMTGEIQRCREAIERALNGEDTAVVTSGDPGIYAMAGLVYELLAGTDALYNLEVEVIPGIPALSAAASLLGAPLMHDFAVISLSDLLTPWELIEKRVEKAVEADYVVVISHPRSQKRDWQLDRVLEILNARLSPETPAGVVCQAARPEQWVQVTSLQFLDPREVDMSCLLIIGNSSTRIIGDKMVTPRGYAEKYDL